MAKAEYAEVPIGRLRANPFNPRKTFDPSKDDADALKIRDMAESLKKDGVLQPIIVRRKGPNYEVAAGERRRRAAEIAGLARVPVVVREMDDATLRRLALVENLHRLDMTDEEKEQALGKIWETTPEYSNEAGNGPGDRGGIKRMAIDLGIPRTTLRYYIDSYTMPKGGLAATLSPRAKVAAGSLLEESPRAARVLSQARATGGLSQHGLEEAVHLVKRAPAEKKEAIAEGIADAAQRRARTVSQTAKITEQNVEDEIKDAAEHLDRGKIRSQLQILVRGDQALLNRVAGFVETVSKFDILFLESFKDPKNRAAAIGLMREAQTRLRKTLEAALEPSRNSRWEKEWAEVLRETSKGGRND